VVSPRARAAAALALLAAAGCDASFTPQHLVRDLRVLSIRAEVVGSPAPGVADPDVGETLRLAALVADPRSRPDLRVEWYACIPDPAVTVPPCLDPDALRDLDRLPALPGVVQLGVGLEIDAPVPAELQPAVDALVARAASRPELACTLYAELPVVAVARAGSEARVAVKPARVAPRDDRSAYVRNVNPTIAAARSSPESAARCGGGLLLVRPCATAADCGAGVACVAAAAATPRGPTGACDDPLPRGAQDLCASAGAQSAQIQDQCDPAGNRFPLAEELRWQWYATGGSFDTDGGAFDLGNATGDRIGFTPPEGPFTLWLILRDGRGGEDWLRRDFR
jgi:hypothetical protein